MNHPTGPYGHPLLGNLKDLRTRVLDFFSELQKNTVISAPSVSPSVKFPTFNIPIIFITFSRKITGIILKAFAMNN